MSNTDEHIKKALQNGESPADPAFAGALLAQIQSRHVTTPSTQPSTPKSKTLLRFFIGSFLLNIILATIVFTNYSSDGSIEVLNGIEVKKSKLSKTQSIDSLNTDTQFSKTGTKTIETRLNKPKHDTIPPKQPTKSAVSKTPKLVDKPIIQVSQSSDSIKKTENELLPTLSKEKNETEIKSPLDKLSEEDQFLLKHGQPVEDSSNTLFIKRK